MKKVLVIQHVAIEPLGTLNALLRSAGFRIRYANFGRDPHLQPNIDGYDGLIILGGPMNVDETKKHPHLLEEIKIIEAALKKEIPVLGICLGAQLLAKTLGAEVKKNHTKEIGWYTVHTTADSKNDALLKHFLPEQKIFQWHGDTFDIPHGATHLAKSEICENQAFRYGDKSYGLQFHLEVDQKFIERLLNNPSYHNELIELKGTNSSQILRQENDLHLPHATNLGTKIFDEFIQLFGEKKRSRVLPSR